MAARAESLGAGRFEHRRIRGAEAVRALARSGRRGAAARHVAREGHRRGLEVRFGHRVHEAGPQRVGRVYRPPRKAHLERLRDAHEPRQPLRALGAGDDAQVHLGQAETRRRGRHPIVPRHRQLEPAAERRAVERHHQRPREVLDPRQQLVEVGRLQGVVPDGRLQLLDVGAGHEGAAGPRDDYRLDPARRSQPLERRCERRSHGRVERVHRGVVDAEDSDPLPGLDRDALGLSASSRHVSSPHAWPRSRAGRAGTSRRKAAPRGARRRPRSRRATGRPSAGHGRCSRSSGPAAPAPGSGPGG